MRCFSSLPQSRFPFGSLWEAVLRERKRGTAALAGARRTSTATFYFQTGTPVAAANFFGIEGFRQHVGAPKIQHFGPQVLVGDL